MSTKNIAVDRAIALLNAAGAVYEVHYEGQVYGELPKQKGSKGSSYIIGPLRGKMTRHIREGLQSMQAGETLVLDLSNYDLKVVASDEVFCNDF